jgi:hypothetical protein
MKVLHTSADVDESTDAPITPFSENNLWALSFGNGASGGAVNTLYFAAAGPGGTDGLFGSLPAIPSLSPEAPIVPNRPDAAFQTVSTILANGDGVNPTRIIRESWSSSHPGMKSVSVQFSRHH